MNARPPPKRPPCNIILLSDGTGNSRGKAFRTNVWRTYEAIDLTDPATLPQPRQFAFYDDGVGTSSFKPFAILGGALGFGLARNVRDLYGFLCRMYMPGDRIYAFGFSRGAFTIRVLAGLIHNQGIVRYEGNEADLLRLVKGAYRAYRKRYVLKINYIGPLRVLRDAAISSWAWVRGKKSYAEVEPTNRKNVPIEFIGVWDTVAAYGMPVDELAIFWNAVVWPTEMPDAKLNQDVKHAVHALSLDDERNTFHPQLWDLDDRISQVWFAGVHSDVGGGYPDQGLAHVSLDWVLGEAQKHGLRFVAPVRAAQQSLSDENGPMNDSRQGIAGYYRYNPRRLEALLHRHQLPRPLVHESVVRRIRVGNDAYAPIVLPPEFDVLPIAGVPTPVSTYWKGCKGGPPIGTWTAYAQDRELAFNRVWVKRVVYFATLGLTAVLALLPLIGPAAPEGCDSAWCWASPPIRALDVVLPAFAAAWTQWYARQPLVFYALVVPIALGLWGGGVLQRAVGDAMRRAWYAMGGTRPAPLPDGCPTPVRRWWDRPVQALRTWPKYRTGFRVLSRQLLPTAFGVAFFAVIGMLASIGLFALQASSGQVCEDSARLTTVGTDIERFQFESKAICKGTHLGLQAGGTYEIEVRIDPAAWKDSTLKADLRGVAASEVPLKVSVLTPLRRESTQPWMAPMVRIGDKGTDLYPLRPDPSMPLAIPVTVLRTEITARTTGELFLYVNDGIGPPFAQTLFYDNNEGTAEVAVRRRPAPCDLGAPVRACPASSPSSDGTSAGSCSCP